MLSALLLPFVASSTAIALPQADARFVLGLRWPEKYRRLDKSASAYVRLDVDPAGKVLRCETLATEGLDDLAKLICGMAEGERMDPALGPDGQATYSRFNTIITLAGRGTAPWKAERDWSPPGDYATRVNLIVPVSGFTTADSTGAVTTLRVRVTTSGMIDTCQVVESTIRALASVACQELAGHDFGRFVDERGEAVSYVTNARVNFVDQAAHAHDPAVAGQSPSGQ